ncbi:MAG TPA: hypothetical protein VHK86_08275 [Nitrososphaera sp.]|nr:hypothetical protein [Nitrososphaera sp.]
MMAFEGPEKRKQLLSSMLVLAALVGGAVIATVGITSYFRSQDPVNQCIGDPNSQPFQLSIPVTVTEDGSPALVKKGIGIVNGCTRPVHTLEENVIHVAYRKPYPFTLGHFLFYWLKDDLLKYDTKVYVNGTLHTDGDIRDIVLKDGDSIRIELTTKNK